MIVCCLIGAYKILNAQDSGAEAQALKLEVQALNAQLKEEKQKRIKAQLDLLHFLSKDLPSQPDDSKIFEPLKSLALNLAVDLPQDVSVWQALVRTNSLEGVTLQQASTIIGEPTGNSKGGKYTKQAGKVTEYSWYYNPHGRQVAPCLIAKVENGKLNDWAVIRR